ncbi:hypothetical protein GW17_00049576, partial [Ensete ventricosum]
PGALLVSALIGVLPVATSTEEHPDVSAPALAPVEGCRDDGLDHPGQRLDLLGETKECLGCHNGRPKVRWGRSES